MRDGEREEERAGENEGRRKRGREEGKVRRGWREGRGEGKEALRKGREGGTQGGTEGETEGKGARDRGRKRQREGEREHVRVTCNETLVVFLRRLHLPHCVVVQSFLHLLPDSVRVIVVIVVLVVLLVLLVLLLLIFIIPAVAILISTLLTLAFSAGDLSVCLVESDFLGDLCLAEELYHVPAPVCHHLFLQTHGCQYVRILSIVLLHRTLLLLFTHRALYACIPDCNV